MNPTESPRRQTPPHSHEARETRVQFLDDSAKAGVVVACETSHPRGVLAPLVDSLADLDLEVHQIESRLSNGMRSERLWIATPDGAPLSQRRQGLLRTAVLSALEAVNHTDTVRSLANDRALGELSAG